MTALQGQRGLWLFFALLVLVPLLRRGPLREVPPRLRPGNSGAAPEVKAAEVHDAHAR